MTGLRTERLRQLLASEWGLERARVVPHDRGMNSRTWHVRQGDDRWIAKALPAAERRHLEGGMAVAAHVARAGMLRLRWAVQADYFARRIAADDLTGIASRAENEKGLEDARVALERLR